MKKPKPYTLKQYGTIVVREYSEGLPDKTLADFWKGGERRKLTSEETEELSASEWVKYYFWLQAFNAKRLLK